METKKLEEIIRGKNAQLEHRALESAEQIIEDIVKEQALITASSKRIEVLRDLLAKLQVQEIDPKAVLGGGV